MKCYPPLAVAKYIADKIPITHLRLHKMIYLVHGYHLALYNKPIISERFEASQYGPIIRTLFDHIKHQGTQNIKMDDVACANIAKNKAAPLIDKVLSLYENYSPNALVSLVCERQGPWFQTFKTPVSLIDNKSIETYFKHQLKDAACSRYSKEN